MRTISLLGLLVVWRLLVLEGRNIPFSLWNPVAYFWQDLLVVLVFGALEKIARRPPLAWLLYLGAVLYLGINLLLMRILSTPLTISLLRAADHTLSDSIRHYFDGPNFLLFSLFVGTGVLLPFFLRWLTGRINPRVLTGSWLPRFWSRASWEVRTLIWASLLFLIALAGPFSVRRTVTSGLERNPIIALLASALPRLRPVPADKPWRISPFPDSRPQVAAAGPSAPSALTNYRGQAKDRNVVMILLESAAARYLKLYGAAEDPMPNLTVLARQALLFESAYAVYPESIKGLFSVLCSQPPAFDTKAEDYARVRSPSVASVLAAHGYRTGLFHSGRFLYLGMREMIAGRGFETMEDAGAIGGHEESSFGVDEPATVDRILGWIDHEKSARPFFVTYLPIAGHHPYSTPQPGPFPGTEDRDRYLNALHYADEAVGRLLQGLTERGLMAETVFLIFGDHGEAFGQHEGNYGHTLYIYEENVHVPYLIAAPGLINGPQRVSRPISLVDTAPTLLDLLGLPAPATFTGTSALSEPAPGSGPLMALFFTDYSLGWLGLRDGAWSCLLELDSGRRRLFHLKLDPEEKVDLSEYFPERAGRYSDRLEQWSRAEKARFQTASREGAYRSTREGESPREPNLPFDFLNAPSGRVARPCFVCSTQDEFSAREESRPPQLR